MNAWQKIKAFFIEQNPEYLAETGNPLPEDIHTDIQGQEYTREFREYALTELREGRKTRREISDEFGVNSMLLSRWVADEAKYGIGYKTTTEVRYERNLKIKEDDATGKYTAQMLAEKYDMSEANITYIRRQIREGKM